MNLNSTVESCKTKGCHEETTVECGECGAGMDVSSTRCVSGQGGHPSEPCRGSSPRASHGLAPPAGKHEPPKLPGGAQPTPSCIAPMSDPALCPAMPLQESSCYANLTIKSTNLWLNKPVAVACRQCHCCLVFTLQHTSAFPEPKHWEPDCRKGG